MEWPEMTILKLINLYSLKPLLWDPKHHDHFRKDLKQDAWREIGAEIDLPGDQCKKKMICILASYRREKNKTKRTTGTGKGRDEIYLSRWFAYEALKFLEDKDEPRNRLSTETSEILKEEIDVETVTPSAERDEETTASSSTLKSTQRQREKRQREDMKSTMMNTALNILKTAAEKLDKQPFQPDEIDSFFSYASAKVRKYSPEAKRTVQQAVFDILMKADTGMFDWPPFNYQHLYNSQRPTEIGPSHAINSPSVQSVPTNCNQPSPAPSVNSEYFQDLV